MMMMMIILQIEYKLLRYHTTIQRESIDFNSQYNVKHTAQESM